MDNIVPIGEKIREKIGKSEISEALTREIMIALHKIGVDNYYAVR